MGPLAWTARFFVCSGWKTLVTWVSHTAGDLCAAESAAGKGRPEHGGLVLTACILASSLAFVDGSVVNVGLPAIGQSLQGDPQGLQWVINAYLLPLSALLLLGALQATASDGGACCFLGWCCSASVLPYARLPRTWPFFSRHALFRAPGQRFCCRAVWRYSATHSGVKRAAVRSVRGRQRAPSAAPSDRCWAAG